MELFRPDTYLVSVSKPLGVSRRLKELKQLKEPKEPKQLEELKEPKQLLKRSWLNIVVLAALVLNKASHKILIEAIY